ncbi:MAG: Oligopeptide transport ATP-binding protein OppD [Firmicutes bacterium]|nr:Oligopeptide transport ATP-binding protein OppD [Bacillota bacterium]
MSEKVLEVKGLKTYFYTDDGVVPAVDGVDFEIRKGETLGIVGESGCGKSVTSLSVMRLIPSPPGKITEGQIIFKGKDIVKLSEDEMRKIRGNDISMIFQEPMTSLNPVYTIGDQISEALMLHQGMNKEQALNKSIEMLSLVGIPLPEQRVHEYPHQLSGGMRQRVMIAMALACNPEILIADEPTTALDVTIQAQILELMKDLKDRLDAAIMLITHDLGVIAEVAENVLVMYAGKVVEYSDVMSIFKNPKHPYTKGLLNSIPKLNETREKLDVIEGIVPNPYEMPEGCRFHPRCKHAREICKQQQPELIEFQGHQVRCFMYTDHWTEGGK